jgi:hypothetical protein
VLNDFIVLYYHLRFRSKKKNSYRYAISDVNQHP